MVRCGYVLSSEEHRPADLIRNAARAEESGLEFALISDHNRGASAMAADHQPIGGADGAGAVVSLSISTEMSVPAGERIEKLRAEAAAGVSAVPISGSGPPRGCRRHQPGRLHDDRTASFAALGRQTRCW